MIPSLACPYFLWAARSCRFSENQSPSSLDSSTKEVCDEFAAARSVDSKTNPFSSSRALGGGFGRDHRGIVFDLGPGLLIAGILPT